MTIRENYEQWLKDFANDPETIRELEAIRDDEKEMEDRFYTELSFGTAGMRGVLGAGMNRMNKYNVRRVTRGLARYLLEKPEEAKRGVVIAYDSDGAGQNATQKAINHFSDVGLRTRILHMDGAKDPDEYIKKFGAQRFRNLIAGFAQDKVVILSTHIVSDVEFIANRILVMRQGSFVLDGTPEQVVKQAAGKVWECHVDARRAEGMSASLQVANVRYAPDGHAVVRVVADRPPMEGAVAVEPTLEDLYLLVFRDAGNR